MSTKTRVLVLGGGGMLGHKLVETFAADASLEVHAAVRTPLPHERRAGGVVYHENFEAGRGHDEIRALLGAVAPGVVVNALGAIKQKDLASSLDETFYLNAILPHLLTLLNPVQESRVIHFSTDCVYKGDSGNYAEVVPADAEDVYGRSKACGEISYGRHLTFRTSIIGFELRSHLGLLSWFFGLPKGSTVKGFRNAIFSGIPTVTLSRIVLETITERPRLTGLLHVASEPINKFDLLSSINERFALDHHIIPDESFVIDRSLDDSRFRELTGTRRPGWDRLIEDLAQDFTNGNYKPIYDDLRQSRIP